MTRGRVVVIGGGPAGVAAALRCLDSGFEVTLLESRPRLGGCTYSFRRGELTADTGQHVFLRCYSAYLALLRRLGVGDDIRMQPRFRVPVLTPQGRTWQLRRNGLPAPAHLIPVLFGHRALTPAQRLVAARTALALRKLDPDDPALDTLGFGTWLRARGEPERCIETLWGLFSVAALNTDPDSASLALAVKVFRTGLLDTAEACDIGVLRRPLGDVHDEAARRVLTAAGARVRLRTKATALRADSDGYLVRAGDDPGEELGADAVVLAVPHSAAARLLDGWDVPGVGAWQGLSAAPIVNVHAHYDRHVLDPEMAAAVDSPVQWLFDRTRASGASHGQYLVVSLSAAHELMATRTRQLREEFVPELGRLLPRTRRARMVDFFVSREPAATFLPAPGTRALRPSANVGPPGLALAGAWTDTGWPDTLEGAVRSGNTAADVLTGTVSAEYSVMWR